MTQRLRVDAILRRLATLDATVKRLRRFRGITVRTYNADEDVQWIIERGLQRAAECVLDVGSHVLAALAVSAPEDYTTIIDRLVAVGALEPAFGQGFRGIGGFRNVLIHEYLDIDSKTVVDVVNHRLDDFDSYARQIQSFLHGRGLLQP